MRVFDVFLRTKTAVRSGKTLAMISGSGRLSALVVQAGGPDLKRDSIQWRVPPVLRFWGPGGSKSRAAGNASNRAIADFRTSLFTPIRFPRPPASPLDALREYSSCESVGGEK